VVRYLEVWLGRRRNGIAWIEYDSDLARDMAIEALERTNPSTARVQVSYASTRADWETLRKQLESAAGLVHVTFSATIGSSAIPQRDFADFALAMNLDREPIFALDYPQVWWLRKELAVALQDRAPDFVSWVHLRMVLDEAPAPREHGDGLRTELWENIEPKAPLFDGATTDGSQPAEASAQKQMDVDAARVAVYQARRLAATDPETGNVELASRLREFGRLLAGAGRLDEALLVARELTSLYRLLTQRGRDHFLPSLAGALTTLAALQREGLIDEALVSAREAVSIYQELAEGSHDVFLPALAGSQNNLAIVLSGLGRREEALAQAEESVRIQRQLARERPDAFLPGLAIAVNNLANRFNELGRPEEALAQVREAVHIYRQLAEARPDAFLPGLALSANNLANRLSELGSHEEA